MPNQPPRLRLATFGLASFVLGCLYLFDIRVGGKAIALGLGAFAWLHIALFSAAFVAGLCARTVADAALTGFVMILSEGFGILVWVVALLARDSSNNLWPLGLVMFVGAGALAVVLGTGAGFGVGSVFRRGRSASTDAQPV